MMGFVWSLWVASAIALVTANSDTLYFKPRADNNNNNNEQKAESVICPDKQGSCPDGETCCLLKSGKYGCCPMPKAVCCSDHTHCCPHNYVCNVPKAMCDPGDGVGPSLSLVAKKPAEPLESDEVEKQVIKQVLQGKVPSKIAAKHSALLLKKQKHTFVTSQESNSKLKSPSMKTSLKSATSRGNFKTQTSSTVAKKNLPDAAAKSISDKAKTSPNALNLVEHTPKVQKKLFVKDLPKPMKHTIPESPLLFTPLTPRQLHPRKTRKVHSKILSKPARVRPKPAKQNPKLISKKSSLKQNKKKKESAARAIMARFGDSTMPQKRTLKAIKQPPPKSPKLSPKAAKTSQENAKLPRVKLRQENDQVKQKTALKNELKKPLKTVSKTGASKMPVPKPPFKKALPIKSKISPKQQAPKMTKPVNPGKSVSKKPSVASGLAKPSAADQQACIKIKSKMNIDLETFTTKCTQQRRSESLKEARARALNSKPSNVKFKAKVKGRQSKVMAATGKKKEVKKKQMLKEDGSILSVARAIMSGITRFIGMSDQPARPKQMDQSLKAKQKQKQLIAQGRKMQKMQKPNTKQDAQTVTNQASHAVPMTAKSGKVKLDHADAASKKVSTARSAQQAKFSKTPKNVKSPVSKTTGNHASPKPLPTKNAPKQKTVSKLQPKQAKAQQFVKAKVTQQNEASKPQQAKPKLTITKPKQAAAPKNVPHSKASHAQSLKTPKPTSKSPKQTSKPSSNTVKATAPAKARHPTKPVKKVKVPVLLPQVMIHEPQSRITLKVTPKTKTPIMVKIPSQASTKSTSSPQIKRVPSPKTATGTLPQSRQAKKQQPPASAGQKVKATGRKLLSIDALGFEEDDFEDENTERDPIFPPLSKKAVNAPNEPTAPFEDLLPLERKKMTLETIDSEAGYLATSFGDGSELFAKLMVTARHSDQGDITCPDKVSTCPAETTCCKMQSGWYGCCPKKNAVCCKDHLHCCEEGQTCDEEKGLCKDGELSLPWEAKFPATPAPPVGNVKCPDEVSYCPDGTTCCLLSSGQYGCCPLQGAVCCNDHVHCCPHGYTCDVQAEACKRGESTIPFLEKIPSKSSVSDVVCPDKSSCPNGSTCCQLDSETYGCCPYPKAVCCSDHRHCCPEGYTCDVKAGACNKDDGTLAFLEKLASTPSASEGVECPDQKSTCPTGTTCCELPSGGYGCCPFAEAVCCSDHEHCCPKGSTCTDSSCKSGDTMVPFVKKLPATPKVPNELCPDQKSTCPAGTTCCKMSSGDYGCCPFPKAVCCSDHVHCCPQGYTCDVSAGTCKAGDSEIPFLKKFPATPEVPNGLCPDKKSSCPSGTTCCKMSSGDYGCCPFPEAVCCSDHVHCCPQGYTCDVSAGTCKAGDSVIPFLKKFPATPEVLNGLCPDKKSSCPSGTTCCKLSSGDYGCCPFPQAVCCSDHLHCCPQGYTCDVSAGTCKAGDSEIPFLKKFPATPEVPNGLCPDKKSSCPSGTTCCKMSSGDYGCCPFPEAVCCSDHVHCCPQGYTCDVSAGTCKAGDSEIPFLKKFPATVEVKTECPDNKTACPKGTTCCPLSSTTYGCCPIPKAVCCPDNIHCCPEGYTCDDPKESCHLGDITIPFLKKFPATPKVSDVVCPDKKSTCPSGATCCELDSGEYGCCPYPKAVCCSDHLHCCPQGYTCDVSAGTCKAGDSEIPFLEKFPATPKVSDIVCPDKTSTCPGDSTCCKLSSGDYGCCPYPKAVCCSDHEHCCPNGYTCDVQSSSCNKGDATIPFSKKFPATPKVSDVVCPDKKSTCPSGTTCCKLSSGDYGCCPYPKAVCCSDHEHCCPNGYTCDVQSSSCKKGDATIPFSKKLPSTPLISNVVCPDGQSECPDSSTCCKLASGSYGCCPLPSAVCCSDHIHCCPNGYACDISTATCTKGGAVSIPWSEKSPAQLTDSPVTDVVCPDQSSCPDGMTCCKMASGYGCCPFPDAVCCSDLAHCCPAGYTCDPQTAICTKGDITVSVPWSTKIPARLPGGPATDTMCPDQQTECPGDFTCCKLASGSYGCCPMPNAVCCDDHVHCCPQGTTCNPSQGTCNSVTSSLSISWDAVKRPSSLLRGTQKLDAVKCKDGTECPWGSTCCALASGKYGCCPVPNAVCCEDHLHCCPEGYVCDKKTSSCTKDGSTLTVSWALHSRSQSRPPKEDPSNSVRCKDGYTCPTGSSCCMMTSGHQGCCPMENAVCCEDNVHCCPHGTECDPKTSKCIQSVPFSTKQPALRIGEDGVATLVNSVICPDRQHQCPDFNTCCRMRGGDWGCCPIARASCCKDGIHCCPPGFHCGPGTCLRNIPPQPRASEADGDYTTDSTPAFLLYKGQTLN